MKIVRSKITTATRKKLKLSFRERVLGAVAAIPVGQTRSYKEIATAAGRQMAYRTVGNILKNNFNPHVPCHRVVRSDGTVGKYNRGIRGKIIRLRHEHVKISNKGRVV